ncbi:uncharacterized protein LOC143373664 [Andrena cerasifolii]|uniref:uncharacterized protein LOC143373664 n=1 Tax=Andrena cerasifolii TaxID=2819439 RepID=UPI004037A36B
MIEGLGGVHAGNISLVPVPFTDYASVYKARQDPVLLLTLVLSIALVSSMPSPGGGKHEHTHFIIHVPELIHKHHHTHVKKIHIMKPEEDEGHEQHVEEW